MQSPLIDKSVLTITASDSCGGTGIQADLNTFAAFGVHGATVVTAVAAQNTMGIQAVEPVSDRQIIAQLESVLEDLPIRGIKTGLLPSVACIGILGEILATQDPAIPLVVDPVAISVTGTKLTGDTAFEALRNHLFPLAALITPNLEEASVLCGIPIKTLDAAEKAAAALLEFGPMAVLLKGRHLGKNEITDILMTADGMTRFKHPARQGRFHGTGSTLSAAIAANLALKYSVEESVRQAVDYVQSCLTNSLAPLSGHVGLLGHPKS
jgi:hydroxymethylpyrimidine/phosphomethylpyrimidine kinase